MQLLAEIERTPGANRPGSTVFRTAVRAVISDGRRVLMVYSPINGDYKFPGGGVDPGESLEQALTREVLEECGAVLSDIVESLGSVVEYDFAVEPEYEIFKMTSFYYLCRVHPGLSAQKLDGYEAALQFRPVWVDIDEAAAANRLVLQESQQAAPLWTRRDTFILDKIRQAHPMTADESGVE